MTGQLTSVSQTAQLELSLQKMAEGESDDLAFIDSMESYIKNATAEWIRVEEVAGSKIKKYSGKFAKYNKDEKSVTEKPVELGACPNCGSMVLDFPKSYSCSKWKEGCQFTIWKIVAKKKLTVAQIKSLMTIKKTGLIKGFKSRQGKSFSAILFLNKEGKVEFLFESQFKNDNATH